MLDRWPSAAAHPALWRGLGIRHAFDLRWQSEALPDNVAAWHDRLNQIPGSKPAKRIAAWRIAQLTNHFKSEPRFANVGPGPRHKNSFQVAIAIDSYFDGAPASALPWSYNEDPILTVAVESIVADARPAVLAKSEGHARKIIASWGAGAKGIVSVRDPNHPTHRVLNVISEVGEPEHVKFCDYSKTLRIDLIGRLITVDAPSVAAATHLSSIDERDGFASIRLWRTADLRNSSRLPAGLFTQPKAVARANVSELLPCDMPDASQREFFDRLWFFGNHAYGDWLLTQVDRGACTFDPGQLARLGTGEPLTPLTRLDSSLCWLAGHGIATLAGSIVEITVPDVPETCRHLTAIGDADFENVAIRRGPIDGLQTGFVEVCIGNEALSRVGTEQASYEPPWLGDSTPTTVGRRNSSWIDANRALGYGSRKTNCWNTASAVANYLSTGAPSTSLPIYREAPLRPTIPQFLAMLGVAEPTSFVNSREEATGIVESWGKHTHGLVLAAWSPMSTHIFNVVHDGSSIRYLDGHTAEDGDFNFDVRWERVGIVPVSTLDKRFWAAEPPSLLVDLTQGVVGDLRVGLA